MCGIVGIVSNENSILSLIDGLKKLAYRGYDSAGLATLENGKIISGEGDVQILIGENIFISSEKFEYNKETGLYKIFNNVQFKDKINNIKAILDNPLDRGSCSVLKIILKDLLLYNRCSENRFSLNVININIVNTININIMLAIYKVLINLSFC